MWTPPNQPGFVPYAPPVSVRELTATPAWERQPDESTAAWVAFQGWLSPGPATGATAGGTGAGAGNWAEAGARTSLPRVALETLSREWSWEARRAAHARATGPKAPTADELAFDVLARTTDRLRLKLELSELTKLLAECEATPALRLSVREVIALGRVNGGLEVMRQRAGILEKIVAHEQAERGVDWSRLGDDELETYRALRDKASA
jgi:hypothetical protein